MKSPRILVVALLALTLGTTPACGLKKELLGDDRAILTHQEVAHEQRTPSGILLGDMGYTPIHVVYVERGAAKHVFYYVCEKRSLRVCYNERFETLEKRHGLIIRRADTTESSLVALIGAGDRDLAGGYPASYMQVPPSHRGVNRLSATQWSQLASALQRARNVLEKSPRRADTFYSHDLKALVYASRVADKM